MLIDSRRGIQDADRDFLDQLVEFNHPFQVILTKIDKNKSEELGGAVERIVAELVKYKNCVPGVLPTSALKKQGLDEVKASCLVASELSGQRIQKYLDKLDDTPVLGKVKS